MRHAVSLTLILSVLCTTLSAQFNVDRDADKGTRQSTRRKDVLASSESAYVASKGSGNVSLTSDSRYTFAQKWEWSTRLASDFLIPTLTTKYMWFTDGSRIYAASKVSVATSRPGLNFARNQGKTKAMPDSIADIPTIIELGNEVLISFVSRGDPNCTNGEEYFILTFSLEGRMGINFNDDLPQTGYHFLANRWSSLGSDGRYMRFKVWVDAVCNHWLAVHGGMSFFSGTFRQPFAYELTADGEIFLTRNLTVKAGFTMSAAGYDSTASKFGILPFADVTYYFGKRKTSNSYLFDPTGRKY